MKKNISPFTIAELGRLSELKRRIKAGFDPTTTNEDTGYGWTVLGLAARYGHVDMVRYLLSLGIKNYANIAHRDASRPLALACEMCSHMFHRKLYYRKLSLASIERTQLVIAKLLVEHGAEVTHRDQMGYTAYARACWSRAWPRRIIAWLDSLGCTEADLRYENVIYFIDDFFPIYTDPKDIERAKWLLTKFDSPVPKWYIKRIIERYTWTRDHCDYADKDEVSDLTAMREYIIFLYRHR